MPIRQLIIYKINNLTQPAFNYFFRSKICLCEEEIEESIRLKLISVHRCWSRAIQMEFLMPSIMSRIGSDSIIDTFFEIIDTFFELLIT